MEKQDVDIVGLQPAEASLHGAQDVFPAEIVAAGLAVRGLILEPDAAFRLQDDGVSKTGALLPDPREASSQRPLP